MNEAQIHYRLNESPKRGLATAGIFGIKAIMAIPHFALVGAMQELAFLAAYLGYWIVAFTGKLPSGLQDLFAMYQRWWTRTIGWYTGVNDRYPPFEIDPESYLPDIDVPRNDNPSKGWAVAGIFLVKVIAVLPWLFLSALLMFLVMIASWIGFFVVAFTGKLPLGFHDFYIGTTQFMVRVWTFLAGLTDKYPRFDLEVHPE